MELSVLFSSIPYHRCAYAQVSIVSTTCCFVLSNPNLKVNVKKNNEQKLAYLCAVVDCHGLVDIEDNLCSTFKLLFIVFCAK